MLAFSVSGPTIGWMLCPPLLVWKERTMVSLCAELRQPAHRGAEAGRPAARSQIAP